MTKPIVIIVLALAFLTGAYLGSALYSRQQAGAEDKIALQAHLEDSEAADPGPAPKDPSQPTALLGLDELQVQQSDDAGSATDQAPAEDLLGGVMGTLMQKVVEGSGLKEITGKQVQSQVEATYLPLFRKLRLSDRDRERFCALLTRNETAATDNVLRLFSGGGMTVEGLQAMTQGIENEQKQTSDQIAALLGPRGYAEYEAFNATLAYRMLVGQLRQKLAAEGHPLTDAQEERLVEAMRQEDAKTFPFEALANDDPEADLSADSLTQQFEERDKRVAKRAAKILSEPQLQVFVASQAQARQMMDLGSELGQALGGGMFKDLLTGSAE